MNKQIYFIIILMLLLSIACKDYSKYSTEELEQKKEELVKERNYHIAEVYIKYSEENNKLIPIYDWEESEEIINNDSTLFGYRSETITVIDKRQEYLMSLDSWQDLLLAIDEEGEWTEELIRRRNNLFDSLAVSDEQYISYMDDMTESLMINNRKILDHILDDYILQDKLFPVDWISDIVMSDLEQYPEIRKIDEKISKVEESLNARNDSAI